MKDKNKKQPVEPGTMLLPLKLDEIQVIQWCSKPVFDKAEQVHLYVKTKLAEQNKLAFFVRFKTAQALDRFIEMLIWHRESAWGEWRRNPELREDWDFSDEI